MKRIMMKMIKYNSKEKFMNFSKDSHYLRVDAEHPLELLIGKNDKGQKTIRFIGDFKRKVIKNTKSISVSHYLFENFFAVNISLTDDDYLDLFYIMIDDLIDSSRICHPKNGYEFITNRFEKWKKFTNIEKNHMSEAQVKGLLGELIFLDAFMIGKYGITKSINGWTGPEPTVKDFSYDDRWYEVKTTTNNEIHISSLEQLDSDIEGNLVVVSLEKLSPESVGKSLLSICKNIFDKIDFDNDKSLFISKLVEVGFNFDEYYEKFKYRVVNIDFYLIDSGFPKISKKDIDNAILNVKYTLTLDLLEKHKRDFL